MQPSEGEEKTKAILSNNIYGCSCVQKIQVFGELLLQCFGIEMCALRNVILCGENQSENQSRFVKIVFGNQIENKESIVHFE